jgi:hypothetical protein
MSLKPKKKGFYLNPIAQLYLMATQLVKVLIAGRGFGKSFVNGISIMMKVASMPKSRAHFPWCHIYANSYKYLTTHEVCLGMVWL